MKAAGPNRLGSVAGLSFPGVDDVAGQLGQGDSCANRGVVQTDPGGIDIDSELCGHDAGRHVDQVFLLDPLRSGLGLLARGERKVCIGYRSRGPCSETSANASWCPTKARSDAAYRLTVPTTRSSV